MDQARNSNEAGSGSPDNILRMNPYVTIAILVAGVAVGLALVIALIFFWRYCVKKRRLPGRGRDPAFFTPLPVDLDIDNRTRLAAARRLESRPEVIRLPMDDEDGSPERLLDDDEENVDSCIAEYLANGDSQSLDHLPDIPEEEPLPTVEVEMTGEDFPGERADNKRSPVSPRRVSFQVVPIRQKQAKYVRRYTEGDFHHLKSSRIKPSGESIKAFSLDYDCNRVGESRHHSPGRPTRSSLPTPDDLQWREREPPGPDNPVAGPPPPRGLTVKAQVHSHPAEAGKAPADTDKCRELSPGGSGGTGGAARPHAPSHLPIRSPRKAREKPAMGEAEREVDPTKGFVPIPADNPTGFAEPMTSEVTEAGLAGKGSARRAGVAPLGLPRFHHPPPQIEICEKPTPDREKRTGDYRELWQLRTTLEMEDSGSLSSEPDTVIPAERRDSSAPEGDADSQYLEPSDSALSPTDTSAAEGPDDGKNRLTVVQRYKFTAHGKSGDSFEQVFSSISTEESDTSERSKGGDSSGKDSASRLKQMQADSGYTSIEHKSGEVSEQQKRYLFASADRDSTSLESCAPALSSESSPIGERPVSSGTDSAALTESGKDEPHQTAAASTPGIHGVRPRRSDRRTASTKRREFIAEKGEAIFGSFSFPEEESEADSQTVTGSLGEKSSADSPAESAERFRGSTSTSGGGSSSTSRVGRIFRVQGSENRLRFYPKGRDYSIDEKTDALFKEFMRSDAMFDAPSARRSRPPRNRRFQLHQKQHSDSLIEPGRKHADPSAAAATADIRSASFDHRGESAKERLTHLLPGSGSSRKLSPQDSVEEDYLRKESAKIWSQGQGQGSSHGQPSSRKRSSEEPPPAKDHHRDPPPRHDYSTEESRATTSQPPVVPPPTAAQRLDLEDVACRPSAFRVVKKSPKMKRTHTSGTADPDDAGSADKPRPKDEQPPLSKGKIVTQTTLVRPTAIHPKEAIPSGHASPSYREPSRTSGGGAGSGGGGGHYSSKGDVRDEYRHREGYPGGGGTEPPPHRRGRSPGRDRSPWRSPQQTPTGHPQDADYADRRSRSPLRMQSNGSSQGSAEWTDERGFLSVPSKDHLDRPHSASSLLRLQREAASPQFERHYSDETYDASRRSDHGMADYEARADGDREHRGSSGRLHPLRCHPSRHIRPATVRTSSETNILEPKDAHKRSRAHDLRRQHYGRAHSAMDVFAANKPAPAQPPLAKDPQPKPRPTPDRLTVRSMTVDASTSPGAIPKERRPPIDPHKEERRHPLDTFKEERRHPLEGLKDDKKASKEERKHPLEGYKEKHKDSTAPLRW